MPVFVDRRSGSAQYLDLLQERGVPALLHTLQFGDISFVGNGPKGKVKVGVEVKSTSDFSDSFDSKRLVSQLTGMRQQYDETLLLVTGQHHVHPGHAFTFWFQAGVLMHRTLDVQDGADWLAALWRWWEKPWSKHSSLKGLELPRQGETLIPIDPTPTRVQAHVLPGVGWELSGRIAARFDSPEDMFLSMRMIGHPKWQGIPGVGPKKIEAIRQWMKGR